MFHSGVIGVLAASNSSYSNINNSFAKRLVNNTFVYELSNVPHVNGYILMPGNIIDYSLNALKNENHYQYTREQYQYFGDPSMPLYVSTPQIIPYTISDYTSSYGYIQVDLPSRSTLGTISFYNSKTGNSRCYKGYKSTYHLARGEDVNDISICIRPERGKPHYVLSSSMQHFLDSNNVTLNNYSIDNIHSNNSTLYVTANINSDTENSSFIIVTDAISGKEIGRAQNLKSAQFDNIQPGFKIITLIVDGIVVDSRKTIVY